MEDGEEANRPLEQGEATIHAPANVASSKNDLPGSKTEEMGPHACERFIGNERLWIERHHVEEVA